eukprot:TRINITY_DN6241_c0_g1_i1.p1 TRINITY_DN6241_c0_g1~~TRINITY_DN6241_c0_g1_i1.p1  ORF type:complete len:501 (+),score=79.69 TRINITY_DN6241_c0_g1_i1:332-1834(+)
MDLSRGTGTEDAMNGQRGLGGGGGGSYHQTTDHHLHRLYHSEVPSAAQRRPDSGPRKPASSKPPGAPMGSSSPLTFAVPDRERFQQQHRDFRNPGMFSEESDRGLNGAAISEFQRGNPLLSRNPGMAENRAEWGDRGGAADGHAEDGDNSINDDHDDDDDEDDDGEDMDGMVAGTGNNNNENVCLDVFQKPNLMKQNHASLGIYLSPPLLNSFPQGNPSMLEGAQNGAVTFFKGSAAPHHQQTRISIGSSGLQNHDASMSVGPAAESDNYYTQLLQSGGPLAHKDSDVEDAGASFGERKTSNSNSDSPDASLRNILSDPLTGTLMDDASILLSCGHSFGSVGIQHCLDVRACATCGHPVTSDSIAPNHSLRAAVQAYRREEEFQSMSSKSAKRRREKFEQEKSSYSDSISMDCSRGKGVQFPFVVNDRVIIKGNKRTPERFVGREAVITTQCLNGWYVVKTLDNAESVKLQYRSLEKVGEHQPSNELSEKAIRPSWLVNT